MLVTVAGVATSLLALPFGAQTWIRHQNESARGEPRQPSPTPYADRDDDWNHFPVYTKVYIPEKKEVEYEYL